MDTSTNDVKITYPKNAIDKSKDGANYPDDAIYVAVSIKDLIPIS